MTRRSRNAMTGESRFVMLGGIALLVFAAVVIGVAIAGGGDGDGIEADPFEIGFAEAVGSPLPPFDRTLTGVGSVAPDIRTHTTLSDEQVFFEMADGTVRLVEFFVHSCPHCQREVTAQSEWLAANEVPDGVEILTISTGVNSGAPNYPPSVWFKREEWPLPVYVDSQFGAIATGYGMTSFPYYVLVDGDGIVVERSSGEMTAEEFSALIGRAAALSG